MTDPGSLRNLDDLQEDDGERRYPPGVTTAFVVLGGACVALAAFALGGRSTKSQAPKSDPLGELVAAHRAPGAPGSVPSAAARPATELLPKDVTFPGMLSDDDKATTALAAVKGNAPAAMMTNQGASAMLPPIPPPPTVPPPASDRLSVVPVAPLPAQAVLEATPIVTRPRDTLTKAASDAAQLTATTPSSDAAPSGREGGYQLQVSSFRSQAEAQAFADQLRARGHRAYAVEAHVPGRGTWYRVRIGPFGTQRAATAYRSGFEAREHVVPFIVPPDTVAKAH
jgi:cell division septation protein DedD